MWLSWYSGRFCHRRSAVRIRLMANIIHTVNCFEKKKMKEKRPVMDQYLFKEKRLEAGKSCNINLFNTCLYKEGER